jgi:hypothetical protein
VHRLCIWKEIQIRKEYPLLLTVGLGGHSAAHLSFLGNQLPNHPELQVVLSAHSPSQAYSNWRGKTQFITVTSGNKYSVSHKNITDITEEAVCSPLLPAISNNFLIVFYKQYLILVQKNFTQASFTLIFYLQRGCVYLCKTIMIIPRCESTNFSHLSSQHLNFCFRNIL